MSKILIIEDDLELQKMYQEIFLNEGYDVVVTDTGNDGLQKAKSENPNLILLDIMLPGGINGFDVLETLKRGELQGIPVVIFSNLDTEKEVALSIGASDYIVKANTPVPEVIERIKKILENKPS